MSMTSLSFSRIILPLALVVLAINTEAIQFVTHYFDCTNSENGFESHELFRASACQSAGNGASFGGSCSSGEYKTFNSTDCSGSVVFETFNSTCLPFFSSTVRIECQDVNDAEYIRKREFPETVGSAGGFDCDAASPVTTFIRLSKCYESTNTIKSFKFAKVNATAYTRTDYTAVGCNLETIAGTVTVAADGVCDSSGVRVDFFTEDVGSSAGLVRISGCVLSFALAFAGILVMM